MWGRLISGNTRKSPVGSRWLTGNLSSVVVDHFYGRRPDITVAGLYCDYLDRKEQTTSNMLGAMLKQLVGKGVIPEEIRRAFEDAKEHFGGVGPRVPELLQMLKAAIGQRSWVVLCIDGLDESLAAHRTGLLGVLQAIVRELPNVRLFLTGRPFIRPEVERYFPSVDTILTILVSPTREDTEAFLRMKLDGDPEPDAMDENLRADIMEIIPRKISEMYVQTPSCPVSGRYHVTHKCVHRFLLVSLSIETILGETTIRRRKEKLKQMSNGRDVGGVYTATLERIRAQGEDRARLGMEAIMWVAYSERPLSPDELCQALGVEIGSTDLDNDNAPSIRTILNCGLGLVTVDSSSSVVRLVHFTLQEHILASPTLFCSPHSMIAEVCLTYLNFGCIKDLSPALDSPPPTTPFLEYASCYWREHAQIQASASVISLALELLDRFSAHISCKLLLLSEPAYITGYLLSGPEYITGYFGGGSGFTALHAGAVLGVLEIMVSLLQTKKWDLNATDLFGNTALLWAVGKGHAKIVEALLEQEGIDPDIVDREGRTPLLLAVEDGDEGIVKMLLERNDVDPDMVDCEGRTPLLLAVKDGHEGIAEMLLERNDVDPNTADEHGQTLLSWAVERECERVVEMLLQRSDFNPNKVDKDGRTPLLLAVQDGHVGIAEMLLERNDVNPNKADMSGRTPLSWAAEQMVDSQATGEDNERVLKMLLERNDVNPDKADKSGRTPLSWASDGRVIEMLLERNDVNPDKADKSGRTPLSLAAGSWDEEIVTKLLERNDVKPDSTDKSGRTPLSWAAGGGNKEIVKILLERNDVNPDSADKSGRTPLSWAAGGWNEEIVTILLERNDVNPDSADKSGRTPLSRAAGGWNKEIVKILLERNDINPDSADKSGRTPLFWAAGAGSEGVVQRLLDRSGVNPNTVDVSGQTPLSWATKNRHWGIVRMLEWENAGRGG